MTPNDWVIVCYVVGTALLVATAVYAILYSLYSKKRVPKTTENFITARRTQPWWRIGWSFYAGAVGCWAVVSPAIYASYAGIVGLTAYAIAAGLPILFIAYAGDHLLRDMPEATSIGDFMRWRYGAVAKTICVLIVLFNMAIGLTAEYTTMGAIFTSYVGAGQAWPIMLIVAFLALLYTAVGGLQASIVTDQIQGAASIILLVVISIYVAVTFREPLPTPLPDAGCETMTLPCLGPSLLGWTTFFVYPVSFTAATLYSEAFWQRIWASADKKAVLGGAWMACALVIPAVFVFGFFGFLGVWSGLVTAETDYNIYMFEILTVGGNYQGQNGMIGNAIGVVAVLLAMMMNIGAVDSFQNGLMGSLSSHFLRTYSVHWTRLAVILINIPMIIVATLNYSVLQLFLISNLLTTCAMAPLLVGLIWRTGKGREIATESSFVCGVFGGVLTVTAYGIGRAWDPNDVAGSFSNGAYITWFANGYQWDYFFVAMMAPAVCQGLWILVAQGLERVGVQGIGIGALMDKIPGWYYVSGTYADDIARQTSDKVHVDASPQASSVNEDKEPIPLEVEQQ
ncbi:hypothetical protein DFJ74DRAFT_660312 [Hyaloraphidium curvatum]|nr:hypothetical protein DFJ74DRAFT_660312 [Hyaloraphidium curvatum]